MKNILFLLVFLVGCGGPLTFSSGERLNDIGEDVVVRARIVLNINTKEQISLFDTLIINSAWAAAKTHTISATLAANVSFDVDFSNLVVPAITNDLLNFGSSTMIDLKDNHLKVCGVGGNQKCNVAAIRMYTTGGGPGLWNAAESMSAPLTTNAGTIGLTSVNAVIVQSYNIPLNKNAIKLSNFPSPTYNLNADFNDAGDGSYTTDLTIEYILSL